MRIMAPASNWKDTEQIIKSGAQDIYVGGDWEKYKNYSFTGRGRITHSRKRVLANPSEIQQMADVIHSLGGNLYYLANTPFIHEPNAFLKYVEQGINHGADYIVLGDLGAIRLVRNEFPHIAIAASSYLEVQNELSLMLLEELGVKQAILSYQCSLNEIKYLCKKTSIQIEVFGHGGCSFYVGTCNMFHEMGEQNIHMGYPCKATYQVTCEEGTKELRALDSFKMCSLCSLKDLHEHGVHSIKIVGRDLDAGYISQVIKIYASLLHSIETKEPINEFQSLLPTWWKKGWCSSKNLCKYME